MADPASFASWKARRLAAGVPLASIEAMRPKAERETTIPGYMPPVQSLGYPQSPQASAPGKRFVPSATGMSLKNDVIDIGQMPGMKSQGSAAVTGFVNPESLTEGTLDRVSGGKPASPFESTPGMFQGPPVAPGGAAPGMPPGALANGFDPRFMNKPKAPLWR